MVDVSVIIPTFRRARELGEALDSVRRQNHVEWEAIVVDDSPEGGVGRTQAEFLADYGALEYYTLKLFNKMVLRIL